MSILEQVAKLQSRHNQMFDHIKDRIEDLEGRMVDLNLEIDNANTEDHIRIMASGQRIEVGLELDSHKRLLERIGEHEPRQIRSRVS